MGTPPGQTGGVYRIWGLRSFERMADLGLGNVCDGWKADASCRINPETVDRQVRRLCSNVANGWKRMPTGFA
jgi:hypothetical protein